MQHESSHRPDTHRWACFTPIKQFTNLAAGWTWRAPEMRIPLSWRKGQPYVARSKLLVDSSVPMNPRQPLERLHPEEGSQNHGDKLKDVFPLSQREGRMGGFRLYFDPIKKITAEAPSFTRITMVIMFFFGIYFHKGGQMPLVSHTFIRLGDTYAYTWMSFCLA